MPTDNSLTFYWELASTDEKTRLKAASCLIDSLLEAQKLHVKNDSPPESDYSEQLEYGLKRLVKGLASSRKGARQGFATVLSEIINLFDCVSVKSILQLIKENLEVAGSYKSQEERDALFGQVFGMMAIVRGNNVNGKLLNIGWLKEVVHSLKQLSMKKSYLQEVCVKAIVDILPMISYPVFEEQILSELKDDIESGWVKATPETLLIALAVQRYFGNKLDKKMFKKSWNCSFVADVQNYGRMAKILQESTIAHPRVHSVWNEVLYCVMNNPKSDFQQFWRIAVDEHLFQSTHDRKYLGFQLVSLVLPQIAHHQVPTLISSDFLRCFINNLSSGQSYLNDAAKHLASSLPLSVLENKDEDVGAAVIQQLLGRYGNVQFDRLTRTKLVDSLIARLKGTGIQSFKAWICNAFENGCIEEQRPSTREIDVARICFLNMLLALVKNRSLEQLEDCLGEILNFLLKYAYFQPVENDCSAMVVVSSPVRSVCEERLIGALRVLSTIQVRRPGEKPDKQDGRHWIYFVLQHAKKMISTGNFKVCTSGWTDESKTAFEKAMKNISKLRKQRLAENRSPEDEAFELLFLHITLQLFSEPEQAMEVLKELKMCCKDIKKCDEQCSKKTKSEKPHWVEVLTEILLSLLTRPSNLLRHVVDHVFQAISSHLTETALQLILDAVDTRKDGGGEGGILEVVEDSDDEDMGEDQDEVGETQGDDSSYDEEGDDDDDDNDDDESDDNNNEDVDEAFRAEVHSALGDAAANGQGNDIDDDLDDEAMMRVDKALAAVFRLKLKSKNDKKKKKDAARKVLHFKLRVMDIIEIFIKKNPRSPFIINLIEPLFDILWSCMNSKEFGPLGERAQAIYKNRLCVLREYPDTQELDVDGIHDKIENLVKKAMQAPSITIVSLVSLGCIFLVRVLQSSSTKNQKQISKTEEAKPSDHNLLDRKRVLSIYKVALADYMERRSSHLHAVLFTQLIDRVPLLGWFLAPDIVKYLDSAVNNFRKTQAIIMVSQIISHKVPEYQEKLVSVSPLLQTELISIFRKSQKTESDIKAKHFREVQKLTFKFLKEAGNFPEIMASVRTEDLIAAIEVSLEGPLATRCSDVKGTSNRLIATLSKSTSAGNAKDKAKKRKSGEGKNNQSTQSEDERTPTGQPHKKKKKKKENHRKQ